MPLLPDPIPQPNVKQLYLPMPDKDADGSKLPDDKKAWVKMDTRPWDGEDSTASIGINPVAAFLVRRILEWNFIDDKGASVPITYENVVRIGQDNLRYLSTYPLESVDALTDEQKKTSTSTSTP